MKLLSDHLFLITLKSVLKFYRHERERLAQPSGPHICMQAGPCFSAERRLQFRRFKLTSLVDLSCSAVTLLDEDPAEACTALIFELASLSYLEHVPTFRLQWKLLQ